jgi:ketosteroid isomerase-like protein
MDRMQLVRRLFDAVEASDIEALEALYDADVVQLEFPNRLLPNGATRDKAAILAAAARGKALIAAQTLTMRHVVESGDTVAIEADWAATLAVDAPPLGLRAGAGMRARFAQFVTFKGDRVVRHATYDCFEPWHDGPRDDDSN